MLSSPTDVVLHELCTAIRELTHDYAIALVDLERVDERTEIRGHQVAGIVGFTGPGLGGMLAIRATTDTVRSSLPIAPPGGADAAALGDWIAEIANQLIGRTKNKLLRYGTTLEITPPTQARADDLLVLGCERARTTWIYAGTTVGPFLVMFELRAEPGLELHHVAGCDAVAVAEGDLMLF
jgi:CheY-specific phosphatase CheX